MMSDDEDEVLMASVKSTQKVPMMPNMEDSDSWEDVPNEDENAQKVQMSILTTAKEIEFNTSDEVILADSAESEEKKKSSLDASCKQINLNDISDENCHIDFNISGDDQTFREDKLAKTQDDV